MTVVCLDTQIIQWGVLRRASNPDQQYLVEKSRNLIRYLAERGDRVILPSIVAGELLVPIPAQKHAAVLERINKNWAHVDYDLRAAQCYACIRAGPLNSDRMREIRKGDPAASRRALTADAMILATALAHGVERIYSNDRLLVRLVAEASSRLEAIYFTDWEIPPRQTSMPGP